jgi:hypothetical protein
VTAGRVIALGEERRVLGFALAAVDVLVAEDAAAVVDAWGRLPADAAVLLLTPAAHAALAGRLAQRPRLIHAVLPP